MRECDLKEKLSRSHFVCSFKRLGKTREYSTGSLPPNEPPRRAKRTIKYIDLRLDTHTVYSSLFNPLPSQTGYWMDGCSFKLKVALYSRSAEKMCSCSRLTVYRSLLRHPYTNNENLFFGSSRSCHSGSAMRITCCTSVSK